ncbi:hypothetical protein GF402_10435 [Candidatus Fermentibacteria bacterium]|nr:hypothetical protein [Candidatus Fermentibacteria bacterium]
MKLGGTLVVVLAMVLSIGCGKEITDSSVPLKVGLEEEFEIVLSADQSTGYHWELLQLLDESMLRYLGKEYSAHGRSLAKPGPDGCEIWRFKTVGVGETQIIFGYLVPDGVEFSDMDSVNVYEVQITR